MPEKIIVVTDLACREMAHLSTAAHDEGCVFLSRLQSEWYDGTNRFGDRGEKLLAMTNGTCWIGIGGIQRDPYAGDDRTARLRRVYIAPSRRRTGVGRKLIGALLIDANDHFDIIRLRVPDENAARFYEAIGFIAVSLPDATHVLKLTPY